MKIKIIKCSKEYCWYKDRVGGIFEVVEDEINLLCFRTINAHNCILKSDCISINDIKYEKGEHGDLLTKCPNTYYNYNVGSYACEEYCKHNCGVDRENKIVSCSYEKETIMKLNLRQLAEDNITFRLETDEDRDEFWDLFIKNRGCTFNNHRSELLNYAKLWEDESGKLYIDNYKYIMGIELIQTWTEIKERYMKLNIECTDGKISNMEVVIDNNYENELNQAIALLQSHGYTITPPYIQPTDEEICERIKAMNEEVGYSPDCSKSRYIIAQYNTGLYEATTVITVKSLGTIYTTQSIAKQITAELNEKRFVRV